jgi:predicted DNA-binding transcriptional regulator AlpA
MGSNEDPIYRAEQAADYLGISASLLAQFRSRRSGPPFIRVGAQRVGYRKSALDAFIQSRTNAPCELPTKRKLRARTKEARHGE